MLNAFIAILAEKGILDEHEATELVEQLRYSMLPGDYVSSRAMIKKLFVKIERDSVPD